MKRLCFCILFVLLVPTILAELTISPQPTDVSLKVGETKSFQITLNNNFTFDIFDFTFGDLENYGFSFPEINLPENSSKTINFTVNTGTSYHLNIPTTVEFKFLVDLPDEPTTHYINITYSGFNPNFLIVKEGDTVKWNNLDEISHTVFSTFELNIPSNTSAQYTFNNIATIEYYDPDWVGFGGFSGTIDVINRTAQEQAHNPNYDFTWYVNLDSILNPTNLVVENSGNNYTIEHGKFKRGVLQIHNNGSERAEIINVSSNTEWITFNRNNFNIDAGETDFIEYTITPIVFDTNETDKKYTFQMNVKATNTETYTKEVSVFVPYKEITGGLGETDVDFINYLENVYCPKHPCSRFCNPELPECNNVVDGNTTISDQTITFNASGRDIYEIKRDIAELSDSGVRTNNLIKILEEKWGLTIPEIQGLINQSLIEQKENKTQLSNMWDMGWISLLAIAVIGGIIYVTKMVNKKSYKKYLKEGAFEYRK